MTEAETRKKQKIEYIIEQCWYMRRGEKLTINNFGKRQDLKLYIYKNKDYDIKTGEHNTVRIEVKQFGKIEDETGEIDNIHLQAELERIYKYKNFSS